MGISMRGYLEVENPFLADALGQHGHGSQIFRFYFVFGIRHSAMTMQSSLERRRELYYKLSLRLARKEQDTILRLLGARPPTV